MHQSYYFPGRLLIIRYFKKVQKRVMPQFTLSLWFKSFIVIKVFLLYVGLCADTDLYQGLHTLIATVKITFRCSYWRRLPLFQTYNLVSQVIQRCIIPVPSSRWNSITPCCHDKQRRIISNRTVVIMDNFLWRLSVLQTETHSHVYITSFCYSP